MSGWEQHTARTGRRSGTVAVMEVKLPRLQQRHAIACRSDSPFSIKRRSGSGRGSARPVRSLYVLGVAASNRQPGPVQNGLRGVADGMCSLKVGIAIYRYLAPVRHASDKPKQFRMKARVTLPFIDRPPRVEGLGLNCRCRTPTSMGSRQHSTGMNADSRLRPTNSSSFRCASVPDVGSEPVGRHLPTVRTTETAVNVGLAA